MQKCKCDESISKHISNYCLSLRNYIQKEYENRSRFSFALNCYSFNCHLFGIVYVWCKTFFEIIKCVLSKVFAGA